MADYTLSFSKTLSFAGNYTNSFAGNYIGTYTKTRTPTRQSAFIKDYTVTRVSANDITRSSSYIGYYTSAFTTNVEKNSTRDNIQETNRVFYTETYVRNGTSVRSFTNTVTKYFTGSTIVYYGTSFIRTSTYTREEASITFTSPTYSGTIEQ